MSVKARNDLYWLALVVVKPYKASFGTDGLFASTEEEGRRWQTTLPDDILSIISDLLPLSDFINFRGVCHNWRRVPSCRSNISELSKKDPWCILYDFDARDKDMCLFNQCNSRKSCSVKLPGLRGAKCFMSKRGWLFIRRNNDYLLFNPLTLEEKFLPDYPVKSSSGCQLGTFSASPSSPRRCVAVLLSSRSCSTVQIHSCGLTANKWVATTIKFDIRDVACDSALLPNPKIIRFKAAYDGSRSSNHINYINILYDSHILDFNCLNKKFDIYSKPLLDDDGIKIDNYLKNFNLYSQLKDVHSDNWRCKFGKEFTFSFCLLNDFKRDEFKDFSSDSDTITDIPVIKAAWLHKKIC